MKNLSVGMLKNYVGEETALRIVDWWNKANTALILGGEVEMVKTSLAKTIAESMQVPLYKLNCHKSIGKGEVFYSWDKGSQLALVQQALMENSLTKDINFNNVIYDNKAIVWGVLAESLMDEKEDVIVLIDEFDELSTEAVFEGLFLEFLEEAAITVPELNTRLTSKSGKRPHIIINSKLKDRELKHTLSPLIVRRASFVDLSVDLLELCPAHQFSILETSLPNLPKKLIRDVVAFVLCAKKLVKLEKPIALSELINWVKTIEILGVKELNSSVVELTISGLVKTQNDQFTLLINTNRLLNIVQQSC